MLRTSKDVLPGAFRKDTALSYIVLADDEAREWGDYVSARAKIAGCNAQGIGTISMRDDFATIYGESVEKDANAAIQ